MKQKHLICKEISNDASNDIAFRLATFALYTNDNL